MWGFGNLDVVIPLSLCRGRGNGALSCLVGLKLLQAKFFSFNLKCLADLLIFCLLFLSDALCLRSTSLVDIRIKIVYLLNSSSCFLCLDAKPFLFGLPQLLLVMLLSNSFRLLLISQSFLLGFMLSLNFIKPSLLLPCMLLFSSHSQSLLLCLPLMPLLLLVPDSLCLSLLGQSLLLSSLLSKLALAFCLGFLFLSTFFSSLML